MRISTTKRLVLWAAVWAAGWSVISSVAGQGASTLPASPGAIAPASAPVVPRGAREFARRVTAAGDHAALPFAVVDKNAAWLAVYRADGTLAGSTPILLGRAPGDRSAAGVGERAQSGRLRRDDRTTPAGRFLSEPGLNSRGEPVVWIDYRDALAIHRLRHGPPQERREQRLASPRPADRRVSAGCVVVPVAFYEQVVGPVLGQSRGVVYVMPEAQSAEAFWDTLSASGL